MIGRQAARKFEDVLDREGVDVDDLRLQLGVPRELRVVLNFVFFGGDEEQIHLPRLGASSQDFVVDLHVFDVERDVLLGLPLNLLGELRGRHHRHGDLANDHRLSRDAHRDVAILDLAIVKELRQRLDDGAAVHHVTIDDGLRRKRRIAEPNELDAFAALLHLTNFDRARTDIDPDQIAPFRHLVSKCRTVTPSESKNRFT